MPCDIPSHVHNWASEGLLYIQKCERICQFCVNATGERKEWAYAWFLRRHVRTCKERPGFGVTEFDVSESWKIPPPGDPNNAVAAPSTPAGSRSTNLKRKSPNKHNGSPPKRTRVNRRANKQDTPESEIPTDLDDTTDNDDHNDEDEVESENDETPGEDYEEHSGEHTDDAFTSYAAMPVADTAVDTDDEFDAESSSVIHEQTPLSSFSSLIARGVAPQTPMLSNAILPNLSRTSTPGTPTSSGRLSLLPSVTQAERELVDLRLRIRNMGLNPDDLPNHRVTVCPAVDHDLFPFAIRNRGETEAQAIARHFDVSGTKIEYINALLSLQHQGKCAGLNTMEMGFIMAAHVERLLSGSHRNIYDGMIEANHQVPVTQPGATEVVVNTTEHPELGVPENTPVGSPELSARELATNQELVDFCATWFRTETIMASDLNDTPPPYSERDPGSVGIHSASLNLMQSIMDGRHDGDLRHLSGHGAGLYGDTTEWRVAAMQDTMFSNSNNMPATTATEEAVEESVEGAMEEFVDLTGCSVEAPSNGSAQG
ncbi:hypothetical protein KVT40_004986 [Elsinoe batatas]|uniref:Uncharacterized protein n=1 Tax=Elsinoe batatas TaxID=2601811 RepID=A0A8K0L866_9PEZI|nr:hypothetical protein KVT40_004986 [Elsinoe batatas]